MIISRFEQNYWKRFQFEHKANDSSHSIVMSHDMGRHWSRAYEETLKTMFLQFQQAKEIEGFDIFVMDNQVIASVVVTPATKADLETCKLNRSRSSARKDQSNVSRVSATCGQYD